MEQNGKLNNARYELDLGIIPKIFHKDPADFVLRCQRSCTGYLCAMFNRYYGIVNTVFFFDNPKTFQPEQFSLIRLSPGNRTRAFYITLPSEHQGSLVYCTAYVLMFQNGFLGAKNARFFTLERSIGGTVCIGSVDKEGTHLTFGPAADTPEETVARIFDIYAQEESK